MNISINEIIKYFASSTYHFTDLFVTTLQPNVRDTNRKTAAKFCGIVYTISGSANFSLNGVTYPLKKGEILHAGPSMNIEAVTTSEEAWKYVVIHYDVLQMTKPLVQNHFSIETGENNKLDYLVHQLVQYDKVPGDINILKTKSLFLQIIEHILISAKMHSCNNVIENAIEFMTENYASELSISEIALEVGCERRKLAYLFDKHVGMTPLQFLTEIRLKQAKDLLRTTMISIKEIADLVGYSDSFYFSRVFKKQYHMTPTQYRNQF